MGNWDSDPGAHFLNHPTAFIPTSITDFTPLSIFFQMFLFLDKLIFLFRNRRLCAHSGLQIFTSCPPSWMLLSNLSSLGSKMAQGSRWPLHLSQSWPLRIILCISTCIWQWLPAGFQGPACSPEHLCCARGSSADTSFRPNLQHPRSSYR